MISTDWKRIYWNVRPGSNVSENIKKLYQKYPDKFFLFKYNLNDLFAKLTSELKFRQYELHETSHSDSQQVFDEWAKSLGNQRFNVLGRILSNDRLAKYEEALKCFNRTLSTISDKTEDSKRILARTYHLIGDTFMDFKTFEFQNNYEMAYETYHEATNYYSKLGDVEAEAGALIGMGESCRHRARYEEAIREYRQAHKLFKRYGFIADAVHSWVWLGEVYVYKGDYGKASWYNSQARRISKKYLFEQYYAWAKYVEADINKYKGTGKMKSLDEDREERLDEVMGDLDEVFKNMENRLGQAWCNQMLAELYRLKCDYNEAREKNEKALGFCGKDGIDYRVCLAYIGLNEGEILRAQGRYDAAIKKYEQVLNTKIGDLQRHHAHAILGIAVPVLKQAEDECLKRPNLKKELMLIKKLKRKFLKSDKDAFSWLHPLEFP